MESFNHTRWAAANTRAYTDTSHALDKLAQHLKGQIDRDQWAELAREMAAALTYSDWCDTCEQPRAPYRANIHGGWVEAEYLCPDCHHTWKSGMAAEAWIG